MHGQGKVIYLNMWMDKDLRVKWFNRVFLQNCGTHHPHLLLLDSHCSHESLALLEAARKENIEILIFPPYCTHALQPLDCAVFRPLQQAHNCLFSIYVRMFRQYFNFIGAHNSHNVRKTFNISNNQSPSSLPCPKLISPSPHLATGTLPL